MVDWQAVKQLSFTLGPIVVPFLWNQYRKFRVQLASSGPPQPVPKGVQNALLILWATMAVMVIASFPYFQPENIITLTNSRMQTPTNVMFERLKQFRPQGFSWQDETYQVRLNVPDGRALYMKFGPDAILNCYWCAPMMPLTYFTWSLPEILGYHVVNFLAIGLATSSLISGRDGSRWRYYASFAAVALASIDAWYVNHYDFTVNMRATSAADLDFFYWRMRSIRPLLIAGLDAALVAVLWLSSTGRLFTQPLSSSEKVESLTHKLAQTQQLYARSAMLQNAVLRNEALRSRSNAYWQHEEAHTQEVMRDPEVIQVVNRAVKQRINLQRLKGDAKTFVDGIAPVQITGPPA